MCCWEVDVDFDGAYELSAMPRSQLAGAGSNVKSEKQKKNDGEIASRDESQRVLYLILASIAEILYEIPTNHVTRTPFSFQQTSRSLSIGTVNSACRRIFDNEDLN